ncbi:MAG: hypothetical protein ACJ789_02480 [Thermomicrobiales bacterium]
MRSHPIPRLLLVGFMFALIAAGSIHHKDAAASSADSSNTISEENVLVQACKGFAITTSYTADRAYHIVEYHTGHTVVERREVSFAGAIGNAKTGKSYAYDGHYTRLANFDQGKTTFSDLLLRFEVGTPGQFSVSFAGTSPDRLSVSWASGEPGQFTVPFEQAGIELVDNPLAVVQAIVPNVLHVDLCSMFGASATIKGAAPQNIDTNEPLQNLDPSQSAAPCDQPRMDPAYNC